MTATGEPSTTIHVRLLDEGVLVWRPVEARPLKNGRFFILPQQIPDYEVWEFMPGDTVAIEVYTSNGRDYLRVIARS